MDDITQVKSHIAGQRLMLWILVGFISFFVVLLIISTRSLQEQAVNLASNAAESKPKTVLNKTESTDGANSCIASITDLAFKQAIGGESCYSRASFTCVGGENNGRKFSQDAPPQSGGCLSRDKWIEVANNSCGCGKDSGNCAYKKIDYRSTGVVRESISCNRASVATCNYEAVITCQDNKEYKAFKPTCMGAKVNKDKSPDTWDFYANMICCYNIGKPACREFALNDYGICSAYCSARNSKCVPGGEVGLQCENQNCPGRVIPAP